MKGENHVFNYFISNYVFTEALLQSRPLPHVPNISENDIASNNSPLIAPHSGLDQLMVTNNTFLENRYA